MKIESTFAILDVKDGRHEMSEHFYHGDAMTEYQRLERRIPVVIRGYIDGQWSPDDGGSTEFAVEVTSVEIGNERQKTGQSAL